MNARIVATSIALTLFAGTSATAHDSDVQLAWQQPGYIMEVVIATGTRPMTAGTSSDAALAWQEPGYVQEVVVATASRKEALKALLGIERPESPERRSFFGVTAR